MASFLHIYGHQVSIYAIVFFFPFSMFCFCFLFLYYLLCIMILYVNIISIKIRDAMNRRNMHIRVCDGTQHRWNVVNVGERSKKVTVVLKRPTYHNMIVCVCQSAATTIHTHTCQTNMATVIRCNWQASDTKPAHWQTARSKCKRKKVPLLPVYK